MNSLLQKVEDLNVCFQPYSVLWKEWSEYKDNGLDTLDIYTITVFRKKDFKIDIEDTLMFYFREQAIDKIAYKLKKNRDAHALWLVKQWHNTLCELAMEGDFIQFFNLKIDKIMLSQELKNILKEFNHKILREVMNYLPEDLVRDAPFERIQRFLKTHKKNQLQHNY